MDIINLNAEWNFEKTVKNATIDMINSGINPKDAEKIIGKTMQKIFCDMDLQILEKQDTSDMIKWLSMKKDRVEALFQNTYNTLCDLHEESIEYEAKIGVKSIIDIKYTLIDDIIYNIVEEILISGINTQRAAALRMFSTLRRYRGNIDIIKELENKLSLKN